MKPEHLKNFHEAYREAKSIINDIRYIANAFSVTGNSKMATELHSISDDLEGKVKSMDDAVTGMIHEEFDAVQRDTAKTLKCLLGVANDTNRIV